MNPGDELDELLLTASEVAELAGVRPSAVSNWRRRHADFPAEVETGRFRRGEIIEWLRNRGTVPARRATAPEATQIVWAAADVLRDAGLSDVGDELLLQLLVLRAYRDRAINPIGADLVGVWDRMLRELAPTIETTRSLVGQATHDGDLRAAMWPNGRFDGHARIFWERLVRLVMVLDDTTDWLSTASLVVERFADNGRPGESRTGQALTALMLAAIAPVEGTVLDPAAGASNVLGNIARTNSNEVVHLYGQEVMERSWRLGFLILLMQPVPFSMQVGDTLAFDRFPGLLADRIVAEPPFGMKVRAPELYDNDERWALARPRGSSTKSEVLWIQHVVHHLAPGGLAAVAVPPGLFWSGLQTDQRLVQGLVERDHVDMVIDLPPSTLSATEIQGALLVLRRSPSPRAGEILFVDLRQAGQMERRARRSLSSTEIERFTSMVQRWRRGGDPTEPGYCKLVSTSDIVSEGFQLSPRRNIDYAIAADTRRVNLAPQLETHRGELRRAMTRLDELGARLRHHADGLTATATPVPTTRHRLGELLVAEITAGVRPELMRPGAPADRALEASEQRFIRGDMIDSSTPEITEADLSRTMVRDSRRRAAHGDLLISRRASSEGEITASVVNVAAPVMFAESLLVLKPDLTVVDPHFLRIYLTSKPGAAALTAAATGTVLMLLDRKALLDVEIELPPLEAQRKIVETVRSIERSSGLLRQLERAVAEVEQITKELGAAGLLDTTNS